MIQNCFSMRPGTIFGYQGSSWKVLSNDTLNQRFKAHQLNPPNPRVVPVKSFRYPDSKEIEIRWKPTE